jgi:hypothetical protein
MFRAMAVSIYISCQTGLGSAEFLYFAFGAKTFWMVPRHTRQGAAFSTEHNSYLVIHFGLSETQ